jgi:hypothetical protein
MKAGGAEMGRAVASLLLLLLLLLLLQSCLYSEY